MRKMPVSFSTTQSVQNIVATAKQIISYLSAHLSQDRELTLSKTSQTLMISKRNRHCATADHPISEKSSCFKCRMFLFAFKSFTLLMLLWRGKMAWGGRGRPRNSVGEIYACCFPTLNDLILLSKFLVMTILAPYIILIASEGELFSFSRREEGLLQWNKDHAALNPGPLSLFDYVPKTLSGEGLPMPGESPWSQIPHLM